MTEIERLHNCRERLLTARASWRNRVPERKQYLSFLVLLAITEMRLDEERESQLIAR
ncbi:hypothetical protein [Paenibacillus cymbidii]|uniref:hypothetical protein n=1 Tax=Paenibacillus cymbidii TaxID=1639034 RepID=UPI0014366EEF|nr:hypothetical protein [Paenibacillus cymbidii]